MQSEDHYDIPITELKRHTDFTLTLRDKVPQNYLCFVSKIRISLRSCDDEVCSRSEVIGYFKE